MSTLRPLLSLFLTALVLALAPGCGRKSPALPRAEHGVLDLTRWNLEESGPVPLAGEWDLHWNRWIDPGAWNHQPGPAPDAHLGVPGAWKGLPLGGTSLEGRGYGTLHLRLLPQATRAPMALKILGEASAYRLWINGRLRAEVGQPGSTLQEEIPRTSLRLVPLPLDGQPVDLVLQVSNFHYRMARILPPYLGRAEQLEKGQTLRWCLAMFVAGIIFVMGLYHLALYLLRRTNPAPLHFGAYCLLWLGNFLCIETTQWLILLFFPGLSDAGLYRTGQVCYFLAIPLSYQFFRTLYPREFPRWILVGFWGLSSAYVLLALLGSTLTLSTLLPWFHLAAGAKLLFTFGALLLAAFRKREGAAIILGGYLIMGLFSLNDMLNDLGVLQTPLMLHFGMTIFMLSQALALSMRFSRLFTTVERLSSELTLKRASLEEEMAERVRLEQEVLSISEEERRKISQELHDGLCQQLTGARLQCAALECLDAAQSGELRRLSALLEESVDHAYNLSHGLWPVEHAPEDACAALADLAQRTAQAGGIPVAFRLNRPCEGCLNPCVPSLYRIAQEALANAMKHARPTRIELALECSSSGTATLTIRDDGMGRRASRSGRTGLGLRMMSHRARIVGGTFRVEDAPGGGTLVTCSVPCREWKGVAP